MNESMNDLTKYLIESILQEMQGGIKVMLPGGFKPPHEGHLTLAKGYADMPNVSEVVILITPKERDGITVQDAKQIWSILLTGISNVRVEETKYPSPLMAAYEYVKNDAKTGETIALGASSKGDDYARVRDFVAQHQDGGKYYKNGVSVVELPFESSRPLLYKGRTDEKNGQPISASQLRADLAAGDIANFKTNYPSIKSDSQIQAIYNILKKNQPLNEAAIGDFIKKLNVRFKTFIKAIKEEGAETKAAFSLIVQAAAGQKKLTDQEKERVGNQMKEALKSAGLVAASVLPGGTIYFVLVRLLKLDDYVYPQRFLSKNAASAGTLALMEGDKKKSAPLNENAAVMAAMAASTAALLSSRGKYGNGGDFEFNPIGWFRDFLKDRKLQKIAERLVQDPEIQKLVRDHTFLDKKNKVVATKNINGIQSILKDKLKPEEMQYLKHGWGPRLRKAMNLMESRQLLKEGGAAGHMAHPYEDADLTFEDIENLIDSALTGQVEYAQEKLDGQNLMVTYKDGKVLSARNKGQLKNAAEKAMSKADMEASMAHLPDNVKNSFLDAMGDMEAAIGKLTPAEKQDYFGNGTKFVNMEVLHPASQNVAAYGVTELRMHNIQEYDADGNVIDSDANAPAKLQAALQRVEATKQSTYDIKSTDMVSLKKTADYEKQKSQLTNELEAIRRKYNLSKTSKLGMYFQNAWSDYVKDAAKQYNYDIPNDVLQNIVNRWAFGSKTPDLRQLRVGIDNPEFQQWFVETDKGPAVRDQKKLIVEPVEDIFLKLGVFVLQSLEGLVAINPNDSIAKMKGELASAIESIKQSSNNSQMSDDDAPMRFLRHQLKRLDKIGGFNAILPTEGIVFKYNGKLYKLTGAFAPLNQIIGYIKFGRK
jgi:hypothetical protein